MKDDAELLRSFSDENSQAAFTELVERYVGLVYNAAIRRANGDRQLAEDVAQQVFITLARQARILSRHAVLSAWLHTATRNAAINVMSSEQRRKARECAASEVANYNATPEWERLRPVLDSAIDELPEPDRAAVVLRFLERRAFAEIGARLRVSEDAARMRTDRALDKLRMALERRGTTSTASALAAIVSSQPLTSAPAGLAGMLAETALATAATGAGAAAIFGSVFSVKSAAVAAVAAAIAFVGGAYLGIDYAADATRVPAAEAAASERTAAALRRDVTELRIGQDALAAENQRLKEQLRTVRAQQRPASAAAAPAATPAVDADTALIQRAMMNNLRQIHAARDQFMRENKRVANSLDELVGEAKYIKRLNPVQGEDYSTVPLHPNVPITVINRMGVAVTYDPSGVQTTVLPPATVTPAMKARREMERIAPSVQRAMAAYADAHGGQRPPTPQAMLPYFANAQDGADFVEALEALKQATPPGVSIGTGIEVR